MIWVQGLSRFVFALAWVVALGWANAQPLPKTPGLFRMEEAEARAKEEQRKREQASKQAEAAEARARRLQEELDRERKRAQDVEQAAKAAAATAETPARLAPLGLVVSDLSDAQKKDLRVRGGVRVDAVDGAAASAGLREGDVIVQFQNAEVTDAKQFAATSARVEKARWVVVLARRGDFVQYYIIKPTR
jgi:hypothetical protein